MYLFSADPRVSLKKNQIIFDLKSIKKTGLKSSILRDHPFKTSARLRGGGVKNLPILLTDSTKKLPMAGG